MVIGLRLAEGVLSVRNLIEVRSATFSRPTQLPVEVDRLLLVKIKLIVLGNDTAGIKKEKNNLNKETDDNYAGKYFGH